MNTRGSTYAMVERLEIVDRLEETGDVSDMIIEERALEIEDIHRDMQGLHDIFLIMNTMVEEQGEGVNAIANNTQATKINIEKATVEINKAAKIQQDTCCRLL